MRKFWSRVHFLIRFLGLTGLLAGGVGGVLAYLHNLWPGVEAAWRDSWPAIYDKGRTLLLEGAGETVATVAVYLIAGGVVAALLALLIEVIGLFFAAGRRSAFGLNAAVQVMFATALLGGINWWSYDHYRRVDLTRRQQFTLPTEVQEKLRDLQGDTTIVVYLMHKPTGPLTTQVDAYEDAAARKVVEKVRDLVDQLREFGSHFRVEILDRKEEDFEHKLGNLTENNQALRTAVEGAGENSIFFTGLGGVQRLSFNEFYRLDKVASREDNDKRGNLVLLEQGVRPFANRVLGIEEKRPKIAVAVVDEGLATEAPRDVGMKGLRKSLTTHGFDVQDVMLSKWTRFPPEPVAYTFDESKSERLEVELLTLNTLVKRLEHEIRVSQDLIKFWETATLKELTQKYARDLARDRLKSMPEEVRTRNLIGLRRILEVEQAELEQLRQTRNKMAEQKDSLDVDSTAQVRRIADVKTRLGRTLADCDLLLIPRPTLVDIPAGYAIPARIFPLADVQVEAIKEYLKAGKPVLACFGPPHEPPEIIEQYGPAPPGPDNIEQLFGELGIKFGKQAILFTAEIKAYDERRTRLRVSGAGIEIPPVLLDWKPGTGFPQKLVAEVGPEARHPIRDSMRVVTRSSGQELDLRIRHPRPVYYESSGDDKGKFDRTILMVSRESWNEDDPFPKGNRGPRYQPTKEDDPTKGTLDEKRRGPFPIGVAVETRLPFAWYDRQVLRTLGHLGGLTGCPTGGALSAVPFVFDMPPTRDQVALRILGCVTGLAGCSPGGPISAAPFVLDMPPEVPARYTPAQVRVAVIGHGGLFSGEELKPANEQLLLHTCNWLLGRGDRLAREDRPVWKYPRLALEEREQNLWALGTRLGLPVLFGYLGLVVLLVRRLR